MKTCKDCIHYDVCAEHLSVIGCEDLHGFDDEQIDCKHFKDKSLVLDLPCKMGDTVYRIVYVYNGEPKIIEGEIFEFAITNESASVKRIKHRFYFMAKGEDYIRRNYSYWGDFEDFGTFVFLTREEAEQALKEREQG